MSQSIGLNEWDRQRRAFEGRVENLLMSQQKVFRLAQALGRKDLEASSQLLEAGTAIDLPLQFEGDQSAPGADRFRPAPLAELSCATLLGIFAAQGDVMVFNWLLTNGANPAQVFADNRDAAWVSMLADQSEFHRRLMAAGAQPNLRLSDGSRRTRLMAATALSDPGFVEQILQYRGNAKAFDAQGRTPLHINLSMNPYTDRDMTIAELLLAAGASPNAEDLTGVPAHLLATEPAAKAVLEGHELTVKSDLALAAHLAQLEAEAAANVPDEPEPTRVHDPSEPDLPQIKAKPKKFRPKPPRL